MNIKKLAKVFGIVLVLVGVLGFVMGGEGLLLGMFDAATLHNTVHTIAGILFLIAGFKTEALSRTMFKVLGIVYAIVTVLGFLQGGVLGFFSVTMMDNILHLIVAVLALWVGFGMKSSSGSSMGMNMPM
jgi:hypothetical protein